MWHGKMRSLLRRSLSVSAAILFCASAPLASMAGWPSEKGPPPDMEFPVAVVEDSAIGYDRPTTGIAPTAFPHELDEPTGHRLIRYMDVMEERQQPSSGTSPYSSDMVSRGEAAFQNSCLTCHDAERSLSKRKSYAGWLATARRMAAKEGADVASEDIPDIAAYLASRNEPAEDAMVDEPVEAGPIAGSQTTLNATISTRWRGSNGELELEKPGFFVDAWVGAQWQPDGPLRATVTACTSCHSDYNRSSGFTVELVEAFAALSLSDWATGRGKGGYCPDPAVQAEIVAGRFVVPFGAFSTMSHPGIYRTVTMPLMFNMGQRVGPFAARQPVLPAPFADEGVNLDIDLRLLGDVTATFDVYAINGLQGPEPVIFNASRRYYDNNREPSVGGRATLSTQGVTLGASLMSGQLHDDGTAPLSYRLAGADATARLGDLLRFYFEYAIRTDDSFFAPGLQNHTYGTITEAELRLCSEPTVRLLARYDTLEHRYAVTGEDSLQRFTWGLNVTLPGGSLLMLNHEHWIFDDPGPDVDVVGLRWSVTL